MECLPADKRERERERERELQLSRRKEGESVDTKDERKRGRGAGSILASRGHYRALLTGEQPSIWPMPAKLSGLTDVRSFRVS